MTEQGSRGADPAPPADLRQASSTASDIRKRRPLFRPGDLLLAAALAALAAAFSKRHGRDAPDTLRACCPSGEVVIELPADTALSLPGMLGPVRVEISGFRVRISESPCPGQYCVMQSWISAAGEVVVCAPSGVWARLEGEGSPDAVSY